MYDVFIFKWTKKTHLTLSPYPKHPMLLLWLVYAPAYTHRLFFFFIGYLLHSQCHLSLHLLWHSLNTDVPLSADLTYFGMENIWRVKQSYYESSRASCGFSSCFLTHFTLYDTSFPGWIKNRIESMFVSTMLKQTWTKHHKKLQRTQNSSQRQKKIHE